MRKAALLLAFVLCGCMGEAEMRVSASNGEFHVSRLFTADGCTVYRFGDGGRAHYFVRCAGGNAATSSAGKNFRERIDTVEVEP